MSQRWDESDLLRILRQPGYAVPGWPTPAASRDALPEKTFLSEVRRLAKAAGWIAYHTHDARKSEEGFPDLVLARPRTATSPGRLIFAELKSGKGKPTHAQATWLSILAHTVPAVEVYMWRPTDLDTILDILSARLGTPSQTEILVQ